MAPTQSPASTQLIVSLSLPAGAAMIFAVLAFVLPIQPMDPSITVMFLGGAAVLGIVGPALGKMLRGKHAAPESFEAHLRQSLTPTLVSLAIREAGMVMAAFYVHFGGVPLRGAGVAGVILLTMLLDVRTPGKIRAEYEAASGRRF